MFAEARAVVDELVDLVEGGVEIGPGTVDAIVRALDQAEDIRDVFEDVVWRHRGKKIAWKTVRERYVDAIRGHTVTLRHRACGHGPRPTSPWPSRSLRSPTGRSAGSSSPASCG